VFGEQVAAAIRKDDWLDDLLDELEAEGYATGATVLPACSVGSPHIRQRLWVTAWLADSRYTEPRSFKKSYGKNQKIWSNKTDDTTRRGEPSGLANSYSFRQQEQRKVGRPSNTKEETARKISGTLNDGRSGWMANAYTSIKRVEQGSDTEMDQRVEGYTRSGHWCSRSNESANTIEAGWDNSDWLWCRDGK